MSDLVLDYCRPCSTLLVFGLVLFICMDNSNFSMEVSLAQFVGWEVWPYTLLSRFKFKSSQLR